MLGVDFTKSGSCERPERFRNKKHTIIMYLFYNTDVVLPCSSRALQEGNRSHVANLHNVPQSKYSN